VDVAKAAGVSTRSVFEHFDGIEGLVREAADDVPTRTAILGHILRDSLPPSSEADCRRLINAAVFGRVI
jgi:AcrR family transcriptional regulator